MVFLVTCNVFILTASSQSNSGHLAKVCEINPDEFVEID
jgi:hypothetical protein